MYVSPVNPNILHVDESNWKSHVVPPSAGKDYSQTGFIPRDYGQNPLGSLHATTDFPAEILAQYPDEKAWKERIEELERTQTDIVSLLQRAWTKKEWVGLNQDPTNYCWCFAVTHAVMITRMLQGEPFKRLSPFSVACIVKNFSNEGGWGGEANAQMVKEGVATEADWPFGIPGSGNLSTANMNAIRNGRQYLASSRPNAALHKVTEFWELKPRNWAEKMACLCIPRPVASGYNWMGHERCSVKAIVLPNGDTGCIDLDSYTQDGSPDLKSLSSSRGAADDAVIPRVITPSNA